MTKNHKYIFAYFALGMFAVFESDSFFGVLHRTALGEISEYTVYGAGCFAAAVGVLLFLALKKAAPALQQGLTATAFVFAALAPLCAGLAATPPVFWVSLALFYVAEGLNAAICAYHLHRLMRTEKRSGTLLAAATVAGLVLNYAMDFLSPGAGLLNMTALAVIIFAMMFIALRKIGLPELLDVRNATGGANEGAQRGRFLSTLITVTVAIAVMSYMIGVNDMAIISTLLTGPEPSVFIPQALLYLPAILIAGVLSDIKEGKYLPIATLGCTLLTAPTVMRLASPEVFTQYSGVTYFLGGFYLIYIMVSLVALARRSKTPVGITSLAVFLFFLFSGLGAFTSSLYIHADSAFALTVYIGLAALLLVIFYLSGSLQPRAAAQSAAVPKTIDELIAAYGITEREADALRLLLAGKSTAAIAGELFVTEGTIYKYISSMNAKTKAESRTELIAIFTGAKI